MSRAKYRLAAAAFSLSRLKVHVKRIHPHFVDNRCSVAYIRRMDLLKHSWPQKLSGLRPASFFLEVLAFVFSLLASLVIVSTIVGSLWLLAGGVFRAPAIVVITVLSVVCAVPLRFYYHCRSLRSFCCLVGVLAVFFFLFRTYSPVLEIRQDPAVNFFKGMNLVNFGTLTKPMEPLQDLIAQGQVERSYWEGYAKLHNGLLMDGNRLDSDMNAGGAFFYGYLGFFKRPWVFLAQILLTLSAIVTLFFVLERLTGDSSSLASSLLTTVFTLSPSVVFFGRAPYSEIPALLCYLLVILLQSDEQKAGKPVILVLTALTVLAGYIARIDYVLLLFSGVILLTMHKPLAGLILSGLSVGAIELVHKLFRTNYEGTTGAGSMFFFKHDEICIWLVFAAAFVSFRLFKLNLHKLLSSRAIQAVLFLAGLAALLFMYRNNLVPPDRFQKEVIHGLYQRTYNEEIVDRLFSIFPAIVVVLGLLCLPVFAAHPGISIFARFALLALAFPYLYSFYESQNSPQLYWNVRRYLYVTMPALLISFAAFSSYLRLRERHLLALAALFLAGNIWFEAQQGVDFSGLDRTVRRFIRAYPPERGYVLLYPPQLRYEASALISYAGYDFLPAGDSATLEKIRASLTSKRRLLLLHTKRCEGIRAEGMLYRREAVGADLDALPKGSAMKELPFYVYRLKRTPPAEFLSCLES